jgi:hypothetical protein
VGGTRIGGLLRLGLLDAGFNISVVAQRQGHGPQVLVKHYAKARRSADRKAAEHLGRVVDGSRS